MTVCWRQTRPSAFTHRTPPDVRAGKLTLSYASAPYTVHLGLNAVQWKMMLGKEENMLEAQPLFHRSFSMVMFTSVMQQDGDSRDCFVFKVKPFCCMRQCMSLSEHLTRSQTVNVFFFLLLLETLFFLIKNEQLDRIVRFSFIVQFLRMVNFILKGHVVNWNDQSEHNLSSDWQLPVYSTWGEQIHSLTWSVRFNVF